MFRGKLVDIYGIHGIPGIRKKYARERRSWKREGRVPGLSQVELFPSIRAVDKYVVLECVNYARLFL